MVPSIEPTAEPTVNPTTEPTADPTIEPTIDPTAGPTADPTAYPTDDGTYRDNLFIEGSSKDYHGPFTNTGSDVDDEQRSDIALDREQWTNIVIVALSVVFVFVLTISIWRVLRRGEDGPNGQIDISVPAKHPNIHMVVPSQSFAVVANDQNVVNLMHHSDGNEPYCQIIEILKECDDHWERILENFKREKVTDKAMEYMFCDPTNDDQEIWKGLLPQLGTRVMFKTLWNQRICKDDVVMIESATTMYSEGPDMNRVFDGDRESAQIEESARRSGSECSSMYGTRHYTCVVMTKSNSTDFGMEVEVTRQRERARGNEEVL